ncbi:MAG: flagellar hook-basal body protein [bacterium]
MLTGLYSAASGMVVQERVQDILAQNLAGSGMPGYQRQEMVIRSFPDVMLSETYQGLSLSTSNPRFNHAIGRVGTGAGVDWTYTNHAHGQMNYTANKTDLAIFGDGFFTVQTPEGFRYTRAGNFHVDRDGYLVNAQGHKLVGQGINNQRQPAPLYVGHEDFFVNHFGEVFVSRPDQNGISRNVLLDQIKIVDFQNKDKLFREEGNIYRVEEGDQSNIRIPESYRIGQGYIEQSNTIPTTEMVKMIDSFRIYEASSRVLRSLDQTLQKTVNEVGRVG